MERPDASDIINTLDAVVNRTEEKELEAMQDLWAARNFSAVYDSLETEKEVSELNTNSNESVRVDFRDERLSPNRKCHETHLGEFDFNGVESLEFKPESVVTIDEALDCHNSGRRQQSFEAFRTLANGNDPKAHYYLGYYYFWGQDGVCEKDWGKAFDALDHLGIYYSDEQNPNKNLVKAFEFYKRSAEHGNKKGYYHLGVCYAKGRGTSINKELALANIKEAANRGHSLAIEQLNRSRLR
ncbi:hypothetical protein L0F63_005117 [Massospora cicadina]|nr:hypothetical protein L0F63_005117 [Massospora cicadina]